MNTKLFKNKFMAIVAMFAIVLGVGAVIAMKAPDAKKALEKTTKNHSASGKIRHEQAIQTWYFTGRTLSQDLSASNYSTTQTKTCDGTNVLPCEIQFDASSYTIPTSNTPLQNYLNAEGNDETVKDDAVAVRSNN